MRIRRGYLTFFSHSSDTVPNFGNRVCVPKTLALTLTTMTPYITTRAYEHVAGLGFYPTAGLAAGFAVASIVMS